jgi:hypothetical protein
MAKNATNSKFKSMSGSKNKYQTRNTFRVRNDDPSTNYMHLFLELVVPTSCIVDCIDSKTKFDETMIITDHFKLTKIFGEDIDFLKVFILDFI